MNRHQRRLFRAAGLVIFRRKHNSIEYLMLQTSYGEHHWTPPKGHVDEGESDFKTALRETEEEASLNKDDLKIYENCKQTLNYNVKGKPKTVVYWLAELINPDKEIKLSDEHQDLKWLNVNDACRVGQYPEMQNLIKACDEFIHKLNQ